MSGNIKCPKCGHEFPMEEAVAEQVKKDLRGQMQEYKQKKDAELARKEQEWEAQRQKREQEFRDQQEKEKALARQEAEERARKTVEADYAHKIALLTQNQQEQEEKLKAAREREMEFMRKEQELKTRTEELELETQRKMAEEREKIKEEARKLEEQRSAQRDNEHQMKVRELEKQLEDQKKLAEEMKRKAEQGSMQLQGEVQELALEDLLRTKFPFDRIEEVGKGVKGADCIQFVRNNFAVECGSIIFESKRTKNFEKEWIDKLKADMRSQGAEIAILVTSIMPKDMDRMGEKEGIWICSFSEVVPLVMALRNGIIRVAQALKTQENKGDKMQMLYGYLTSHEFHEQWKAIKEGFMAMKASIDQEKDIMERLWKKREKQLEKVLLNANHMKSSIEGIAGQDNIDLGLLEDPELDNLPG